MREEIMAIIRLEAGNVGWYDPLSNIHLTIGRPTAEVKAGMNLTGIQKALRTKTIKVIEGSLNTNPSKETIIPTQVQVATQVANVIDHIQNQEIPTVSTPEEIIKLTQNSELDMNFEASAEKEAAKKATKTKKTKKTE